MTPELAAAYEHCRDVVRRSGSSFAATFWMLPPERRRAIHAVYAFCRLADDIADDPDVRADRRLLIERWRGELEAAYLGKSQHPVGIALGDAVHRFRLPQWVFQELLRGVESDLSGAPIETVDELERYCFRVASTVGLLVVELLGYRNPRVRDYAEQLGIAVQMTNVLRDVGDDAASGRVYLPEEELVRFGVSRDEVLARRESASLRLLLSSFAERARLHYERAAELLPHEDRLRLRPAEAMGRIYRALLEELHRKGYPCLGPALRLSKPRRVAIAAKAFLGVGGTA
ncbi:MAG TPA: presqualene diphosphate synthase HpnD [Myxococcota bacterium]|nr:presqualene diphosphate synthase HpnD [Myxococcota bacterium]